MTARQCERAYKDAIDEEGDERWPKTCYFLARPFKEMDRSRLEGGEMDANYCKQKASPRR